jgi:cold shock CspA family protein
MLGYLLTGGTTAARPDEDAGLANYVNGCRAVWADDERCSVHAFDADEGWGVIDGPDVPGGCWVHFSAIAMDGYNRCSSGISS